MNIADHSADIDHTDCEPNPMNMNSEVIALLLPERSARGAAGVHRARAAGAQRLVREPDGQIILEDVESEEEFERMARLTGCFRHGKPILDPGTREVIGYELEEVSTLSAAAG
jgi:hypothetical protein